MSLLRRFEPCPVKPGGTWHNARFWIWDAVADGHVKITLRPGQRLLSYHLARSDEGWNSTTDTYEHFGPCLHTRLVTDGRDCDGRLSTATQFRCGLHNLRDGGLRGTHTDPFNRHRTLPGVPVPAWEAVSSRQRDYTAEAANY